MDVKYLLRSDFIQVCMDRVIIAGQMVKRPDYVPRGVWISFWERARHELG